MLAWARFPFRLACVLCLAVALTAASPCRVMGLDLSGTPSRFEQKVTLDPLGNATVSMTWVLPQQEYTRLKGMLAPPKTLNLGPFEWDYRGPATPAGALSFLGLRNLPVQP